SRAIALLTWLYLLTSNLRTSRHSLYRLRGVGGVMRKLSVFAPLFYFCIMCSTYGAQAQDSTAEQSIVQGAVENVTGSPIALSHAAYTEVISKSMAGRFELVVSGVTVENISGKPMRRLSLRFRYGSGLVTVVAVDRLAAGETRDNVDGHT